MPVALGVVLMALAISGMKSHHAPAGSASYSFLSMVFIMPTYLSAYPLARGFIVAMYLC